MNVQSYGSDRMIAAPRLTPEHVLTERLEPGEPVVAAFQRLHDKLASDHAELLSLMIYATPAARREIDCAIRDTLGEPFCPITWVESPDRGGPAFSGVQAFAVTGGTVTRVRVGQRVVG